jgi:hypothetical protein
MGESNRSRLDSVSRFYMKAPRLQYLLLALVTTWLGAAAVHATDAASPIGLWKGEDATFEMCENEVKLSGKGRGFERAEDQ